MLVQMQKNRINHPILLEFGPQQLLYHTPDEAQVVGNKRLTTTD